MPFLPIVRSAMQEKNVDQVKIATIDVQLDMTDAIVTRKHVTIV